MTGAPDSARFVRAVVPLAPIGLAELVERAALQTRVDRKYVVPVAVAEELLGGLAAEGARVLEIDQQRCFGYESLYYDTPELVTYHLAARGRRRRFKVRRRTYLDSGDAYLEVKTAGVRDHTVKERRTHPGTSAAGLTAEDRCFVADLLRRAGIPNEHSRRLAPTLRVGYRRGTLHLPATDSRVTVDTELRWSAPGGGWLELPGVAVVETKSSGTAIAADRLLWARGRRPCRISKYGTGLAALRRDLPANRWHRTLGRHLAESTQWADWLVVRC